MNVIADFINPQRVPSQAPAQPTQQAQGESLFSRICSVAIAVFKIAAAAALYWLNPTLFAASLFVGIIFDKHVEEAITKVTHVWTDNFLITGAITGLASVLSLPVTLAAGSVLMGAYAGSWLSLRKRKEDFSCP